MLAPASTSGSRPARRSVPLVPLAGGLLGLLGLLALLGLAAVPAHAASQAASRLADQVRQADAVFTATVTGSTTQRKQSGQRGATTTYDVDVERVYKGHINQASVQVTAQAVKRSCRLAALETGQRYVFFAIDDAGDLTTDGCRGTDRAGDQLVADVEKLLGKGRPPVPPEPQKATFTTVGQAQPTAFQRLAAPGAALVLVGLLGLVVVRRLGRRA